MVIFHGDESQGRIRINSPIKQIQGDGVWVDGMTILSDVTSWTRLDIHHHGNHVNPSFLGAVTWYFKGL